MPKSSKYPASSAMQLGGIIVAEYLKRNDVRARIMRLWDTVDVHQFVDHTHNLWTRQEWDYEKVVALWMAERARIDRLIAQEISSTEHPLKEYLVWVVENQRESMRTLIAKEMRDVLFGPLGCGFKNTPQWERLMVAIRDFKNTKEVMEG